MSVFVASLSAFPTTGVVVPFPWRRVRVLLDGAELVDVSDAFADLYEGDLGGVDSRARIAAAVRAVKVLGAA